ncbi:MAG: glycosyltransferase family 4 protein [Chlamydiae bacterium]|nr:glycosyltransferase family 4 protein [Chlamydiota bacterium]MBI3267257.1 glycosyltransferase family 4 protein [Chlamydiota bacterium]
MKVCHVITRLIIGGAQENTLFTVEGLSQKNDFDVTLVYGPEKGPEGDLSLKMKSPARFRTRVEPFLRRNIHPLYDAMAFLRLLIFFRKEHFQIVHTHSSKAGILARLAAFCAGVPVIVHTIHGLPFHAFQNIWVNRLYRWLERVSALWTQRIIAVADAMTRQAVQARVAPQEKFMTIHSGMDLDVFIHPPRDVQMIREKWGLSPTDWVVGKIARLFYLKGHEYLIQAASKVVNEFPKVKFLLVGDGILKDDLKKKIAESGLEKNFIFAGLVSPEQIPSMIAIMDVVVHVSLREGLAKVLPQSLASGKPVIAFDLDGANEVVRDGVNGFLIRPFDISSLSEAILKLKRDPGLSRRLGQRGLETVDPYFRKEYMVGRIEEVYRGLIGIDDRI